MLEWLVVYVCMGVAGTWLARRYALHRALIDQPGERRSHSVATPRGGGISIVIALLVATVALGIRQPTQAPLLLAFGTGLLLVAGIGWIDDHRPLSPWWRLAVHVLAAGLFALAVGDLHSSFTWAVCAFVATLVLTNVWNFMDGIDGLAASQALLAAVGLSAWAGGAWGWLALALAAACAGFLPFNFPRARIFMGDVGSGALGYALGALVAVSAVRLEGRAALVLLPVSVFLVDATLTLARRILRGERWWSPHTQHAYQAWARRAGHISVTVAYALVSLVVIICAWALAFRGGAFITGITIAWYTCCTFFWLGLQKKYAGAVS
ncbi:glycosyltransferase family 4 protein [Lysobacter sp. LF1]|uniref:Glycosyltransferase family 4 protein n=1 Tax=Lysobacter stagni TaxID=3045172 RepID=A0ABT6XHY4_9GAMM|nr:glycosyltransferase family 4 protein [Lysobacter sp. LF1]MDI9239769.1 glycosyltransferase family 4 protein [Lysobacter sp. LF1]